MAGFQTEVLDLEGWDHFYSGKVRDLYVPAGASFEQTDRVLVVASDRISAYDFVLSSEIPDKGKVLTQLSLWWFEQLGGFANHVISTDVPATVAGRAMVCKKLGMYPIECIARGYLTGSGLAEYKVSQTVCELPLPEGLVDGSRLEPALFTPSAKAEVGEHDENISFAQTVDRVGAEVAKSCARRPWPCTSRQRRSPAHAASSWPIPRWNSVPIRPLARSPWAMRC